MSQELRRLEPFYWLLGCAALVVVIAGMRAAQGLIVPFLIAGFIAIVCTPALDWLKQKRVPQGVAILFIILAVSFALFVIAMIMSNSINQFLKQAPKYEANLAAKESELIDWTKEKFSSYSTQFDEFLNTGTIVVYIKSALSSLTSTFGNMLLVLLTVLFMLMEAAGFPRKLVALSNGQTQTLEKARVIREAVVHYISLKTAMSLVTGILVGAWVWALKIDFPVLWGMIAFLFNYVPNVGSILAAIPAVVLALVQHDLSTALLVTGGYVAINIAIGNFVEPRVMGKGLGLSTLIVFVSLVFWGWVLGPVGMVLSVPLTMIVKIIVEGFDETRWIAILLGSDPESNTGNA